MVAQIMAVVCFFSFFIRVGVIVRDFLFFFLMLRHPPRSPLFPYPTLFRSGWRKPIEDAGLGISALNVSGNPLHPNPDLALRHDADLRQAIRLAAELGVDRIVAMSGCPGARSEEHTSELQSQSNLQCRLLLE